MAGRPDLTPGPHPPWTCVCSSQLLCSRLPLPPHSGNFPACVSHHYCFSEPCSPSSVRSSMAEQDVENELLDYEEDEEPQAPPESAPPPPKKDVKGSYVSIHSSGFRDFLLKPELLRAIVDCGFEHPSEGTHPWVLPSSALLTASAWSPQVRGLHRGNVRPVSDSSCALFPQSSTSVFHKPSWAWTSCARPSQGWARQQFLCWPLCSRSSPSTDRWVDTLPARPQLPDAAGIMGRLVKNPCSCILFVDF